MENPISPTNSRFPRHALSVLAIIYAMAALSAFAQNEEPDLARVIDLQFPAPPSWSVLEDADQDGMMDIDEILWGMDPLNPEDGLSDLDGDEIFLAWEFDIGTNPNEADTDTDDWSDSEEYLLYGTDPLNSLSFPQGGTSDSGGDTAPISPSSVIPEPEAVLPPPPPPPSLSNGDFSDVSITAWKSMLASKEYQGGGFMWGAGAIGGWTAYVGSTVEVWDSGGEKFVELDGSPGNYGIKQGIANAKAGGYILTWRQSGRNSTRAGTDPYCVRVYYLNGTTEVLIGQSPEFAGIDKLQWTENAFGFQITPEQLAIAGTNPIYVAFIPTGASLNTYGTLIDNVSILPVEVAVDADRNGEITFDGKDKTTFKKPYRFWINDDRDIEDHSDTDGGYMEEDDVDSFASDCDQPGLEYRRDLEDLTRLWIDFSGMSQVFPASDPTVALKVRIQSESGDPKFTFFQPVESDGGKQYLKDEATGLSQLQGSYGQELCRVAGTASVEIPRRAWETLPSDKVVHLLFEGAKAGDAELIFEIWKDGEKVCDLPTVHIVLKKADDMYETWSVGDVVDEGVDYTKWPASTFSQTTGQDLPFPEKPEEKDYIMFVHGWNMPPWEKETFGSTMFKRMWHQGYKGRFGMFRWPTFHGFEGDFEDLTQDPDHFNASELRAWNSASRLKALIENRASVFGSDKIRLYGHSMGNIVCGEALRQFGSSGAPVHSYIAAQAAISSHVYDKTTPARKPAYQLEMPNVYGYYWQLGASDWPPQWEIDGRPSYMHPQYLPGNVTYINHYNFDDYALNGTRWPLNQDLKPGFNYHYTFQGLVGGYSDYRFIRGPRYDQTILNVPADRYEIFSNAADSVANSLGKVGSTGGKFSESVNVAPLLVYDGNAKAHKYHSGQFRSTIQKRWEYWRIALDNMDIRTPAQ